MFRYRKQVEEQLRREIMHCHADKTDFIYIDRWLNMVGKKNNAASSIRIGGRRLSVRKYGDMAVFECSHYYPAKTVSLEFEFDKAVKFFYDIKEMVFTNDVGRYIDLYDIIDNALSTTIFPVLQVV